MGAKVAKPNPPSTNEAKADADLAMQGMEASAENFLQTVRLGTSTLYNLGYELTDQKMTNQEVHMVVQTTANSPRDDIEEGINAIFSGDWKTVTKIAADSLASFFGGDAPQPSESAVNDTFSKSFLIWENNNVVQYSIFVRRTNAKSVGTLLEDSQATMEAVICKGNIDYNKIDPQTVISVMSEAKGDDGNPLTEAQKEQIFEEVQKELEMAAQLATFKKQLEAGTLPTVAPTPTPDSTSRELLATPVDDDSGSEMPAKRTKPNPPPDAVALSEAVNHCNELGKRCNVTNKSKNNVAINGSIVEAGTTFPVALNATGSYNKVSAAGKNVVVPTEKFPEKDSSLTVSDDGAVRLSSGDDTVFAF